MPANGLPLSGRERGESSQNTNDLVREAVGCNAGLGGLTWLGFGPRAHVMRQVD